MPVRDPLEQLPDTARNLLLAAQRIIAEEGLSRLTLARVAQESGENTALVAYYFGNKAGLIEHVVESIIHDQCLSTTRRVKLVGENERLSTLTTELQTWSESRQDYRAFFELLAHSLRHAPVRLRLVEMYKWYISLNLEMLDAQNAVDHREQRILRGVAQLLSAIADGMAIQTLIGPDEFPLDEPYEALEFLLEKALPTLLASESDAG